MPSNAGDEGSIPGWRAKIPPALQPKNQNIKKKTEAILINSIEELKIVTSVEQKMVRRGGWHTAVFKTILIKLFDSFMYMYNLGLK